jgi:hypothetical protein
MSDQAQDLEAVETLARAIWQHERPVIGMDEARHLAGVVLASGCVSPASDREPDLQAAVLRKVLDSDENDEMLCAQLLDAADRLGNPQHRGNRHAWPE